MSRDRELGLHRLDGDNERAAGDGLIGDCMCLGTKAGSSVSTPEGGAPPSAGDNERAAGDGLIGDCMCLGT